MIRRWLIRLRDWQITQRTRESIDERECKHDGSEPSCNFCSRLASGGW